MNRFSRILIVCLCFLLMFSITACRKSEDGTNGESEKTEDTSQSPVQKQDEIITSFTSLYSKSGIESDYPEIPYVMMIGDEPVTYDEFLFYKNSYRAYFDQGDSNYWASYPAMVEVAKQLMMHEIMQRHAVFSEAERLGVSLTSAEIYSLDKAVTDMQDDMGGEDVLRESLSKYGESLWFYYYDNAIQFLTDKLTAAYAEAGELPQTDDEIMTYGHSGNCARFKQILILNDTGENQAENKALAEELFAKLQAGEDFDTLMLAYSEDTEVDEKTRKDGYLFTHGALEASMRDAVFATPEETYSNVIETYYGYAIINRLAVTDTFLEERLEDLKTMIASSYTADKLNTAAASKELKYCEDYADYIDWMKNAS